MAESVHELGLTDVEVDAIVRGIPREPTPIILVDGRSGAGKTELGGELAARLDAQLVSLDDLYPGWHGLEEGSRRVVTDVLDGRRWRRWDWATSALAEWHDVDPDGPLVVEGCGALTSASRARATFGIWLEVPEDVRRRRALERDGESYRPHWEQWAAQEDALFDRERPDLLADLVLRPN